MCLFVGYLNRVKYEYTKMFFEVYGPIACGHVYCHFVYA